MGQLRMAFGAAVVLLAAAGGRVAAGDYADPSGFSLSYPDGWFAATKLNREAMPQAARDALSRAKVDLSRIAVMIMRETNDDFAENVNVVVNAQQIPLEQASINKLREMLPQQSRSMGIQMDNLQGELRSFGPNPAIVLDYQATIAGVPTPLKQRQVYFIGGGKTFILTYTATPRTFARYAATFDGLLASFKAPPPISQGFDFKRVLMTGVIGGVVGGAAAIVAVLFRKKKPASSGSGQ